MSRMAVALLMIAPAPPLTAEQAMQNYRETFSVAGPAACSEQSEDEAIVVCGRRTRDPRLPLPVEREPGERVRLLPGEAPRGTVTGCTMACPQGIDLIAAGKKIAGALDRIINGD